MNKSDSERIATVLEDLNYKKASNINGADLIVVNMCSVRQSAVDRVFGKSQKFKKLKAKKPRLKTILTGCILKSDKRKFTKDFDLILGIKDLPKWPKILRKKENSSIRSWQINESNYLKIKPKYQTNFSAFIPISNGCNNFCSYCVVPFMRGPLICRSHQDILKEIEALIKKDFKEIWLLGQNVNDYQSPTDFSINFPKLLSMVNETPGNFWIRFTSSNPKNFTNDLIETMARFEKITPYLNLPVQSGDNEILKKMNRPYTIKQYKELVRKIKAKIPEICLSTDVIIGFPGETEKQFQNTVEAFEEIKFDMVYIAQYSPRAQTAAFKLKDNVSHKEKERRDKILTEILKQTALEKNKNYIGKEVEALVMEHKTHNLKHYFIGKTLHYKTIKLQVSGYKPQGLIGKFVKAKILDATPFGLKGKLICQS